MNQVNVPKRMFGYLVDAILIVAASLVTAAVTHNPLAASVVNLTGLFLRDALTSSGSPGKHLAGLRLEFPGAGLAIRLKTSALRNLPLGLPLLLYAFYPAPDPGEQILFTLMFLTALALENWRLRIAGGRRFGDQLANDRVTDLRPAESRRRYRVLIVAALLVAAAMQALAIRFLLP